MGLKKGIGGGVGGGKAWVGLSAPLSRRHTPRLTEGGQPYPRQRTARGAVRPSKLFRRAPMRCEGVQDKERLADDICRWHFAPAA